ncbi:MAG: efflux RND transporter periplasmic adaptor subunit [candidate division WOR-3 bacterium]|nr:MAG: efflux RND transporter periplasmic adaptor subunit [candidate division WOR-3 bacterium]
MKRRYARLLAGLAAVLVLVLTGCRKNGQAKYEFGEVRRGDIENIVSSSGTMEPVGTVEIGTQVSGSVERVLVDFNDRVTKGQLLAILDTVPLAAQVSDARANLTKAETHHSQVASEFNRKQELFDLGLISETELETAKTGAASALAAKQSAEAALERAETNLAYAYIRSPIAGTVLSRAVEPGQTVAASFSTPTLFIVVQDLARMRILALVDESDIGQIDSGIPVRFTVQAFPDREFTGMAIQVRLQPQTVSNVVNYTVVVEAANEDGLLLPGMTATVDFYVEQRRGVLMAPNNALNLQPTQEMVDQLRKLRGGRNGDSASRRPLPDSASVPSPEAGADVARLWCMDEQDQPGVVLVRTGATDGRNTEITSVRGEITEGMRVITKASGTPASRRGGLRRGGFGGPMFGPGR